MASKKDLEDVIDSRIDEIAARVNRVLGDFDANGKPVGPNKDDPKLAAEYIRQIRRRLAASDHGCHVQLAAPARPAPRRDAAGC